MAPEETPAHSCRCPICLTIWLKPKEIKSLNRHGPQERNSLASISLTPIENKGSDISIYIDSSHKLSMKYRSLSLYNTFTYQVYYLVRMGYAKSNANVKLESVGCIATDRRYR
jgi:hypothetical protein